MEERRRHFMNWFWPPPAIAGRLWPTVAASAVYTCGVVLFYQWKDIGRPAWVDQIGVVNAIVIGVLIGFRTKAAYDRWWEGRILWGELINQSRNLCLKSDAYVKLDDASRRELARLVPAFAFTLMKHLRSSCTLREVPGFESDDADPKHVPAYVAEHIVKLLASWRSAGLVDGHCHQMLDLHCSAFMNVCGACERIRNTPLPGSFLSLLRHGLILSFIAAPWHLAVSLGGWAILVQSVLVYFMFGVELTAEEVEQPFAFDPDDLPLEKFCETIRANVNDILGVM